MSTESHWTFNRGRGGSTRSDGLSFNPALKWDDQRQALDLLIDP